MPKFRIERQVKEAEGYQTMEVEAVNIEQAVSLLKNGEGKIIEHEVEVIDLEEFKASEVYEFND